MLVLHPSTVMEMEGPEGEAVNVGDAVEVVVSVASGELVLVGAAVEVATSGVGLLTPITTGVAVKIEGVEVGGRKGVGPGWGWMTQPLQDDSKPIVKIKRINFFISSPP
jgi:hypothetical protein